MVAAQARSVMETFVATPIFYLNIQPALRQFFMYLPVIDRCHTLLQSELAFDKA